MTLSSICCISSHCLSTVKLLQAPPARLPNLAGPWMVPWQNDRQHWHLLGISWTFLGHLLGHGRGRAHAAKPATRLGASGRLWKGLGCCSARSHWLERADICSHLLTDPDKLSDMTFIQHPFNMCPRRGRPRYVPGRRQWQASFETRCRGLSCRGGYVCTYVHTYI